MDRKLEHDENDGTNDTEERTPEDPFNEKQNPPITVKGNEKEGIPAEMLPSDHEESMKVTKELPAEAVHVRMSEVNQQINSSDDDDDDGLHRLHLETPQCEPTISAQEEEEEEEEDAEDDDAPADREDVNYEEHVQLLQELCEERDEATQRSIQLQMKVAEYLRKKAGEDAQLEIQESEQLQVYEKSISILSELKQQLAAETETAQQQAEDLRRQSQEKLDEVEGEWRAFTALKHDAAVMVLSRSLGKQAAQDKVESDLAAEQLQQDELIKLRLRHIKLTAKIDRLEAELREEEERGRDTLQLQFEQLQAVKLEQKKHIEKQSEESLKLQDKISSSLELLSNIKEKLYWTHMDVQAKREQLAEVEAVIARKRDLLTRTKQARSSLQRDNQRLKEHRGLLGNRVLLRDFEDTVDAADHLEKQLENLKGRHAEIVFSCGRWKKPETRGLD